MKKTDERNLRKACSRDNGWTHLHEPFGSEIWGHRWLCATDGHRLHALRDVPANALGGRVVSRSDAPPAHEVTPKTPEKLQLIMAIHDYKTPSILAPLRAIPSTWSVACYIGSKGSQIDAWSTKPNRHGTRSADSRIFPTFDPNWPLAGENGATFALELRYLLEAIDFLGKPSRINCWQDPGDRLAPILVSEWPCNAIAANADRFALIMPRRI